MLLCYTVDLKVLHIGRFLSRISADLGFSFQKLILTCITAIHKSLESFAIVTAENEADNRVDSTVGDRHKVGENII